MSLQLLRLRVGVAVGLLALLIPVTRPRAASYGDTRTITVLVTTDMHGYIHPYDYFTREPAARGLAAAATVIGQVRAENPHILLVDCGDTIQGSPLESVHQAAVREGRSTAPDPMMLAMNLVGYDAMVVGNHEFNFGLRSLQAARSSARFPWISANTRTGDAIPAFHPYVLKTVNDVRVAVIGVTTSAVPEWEKPENVAGLSWLDPVEAVGHTLASLEAERPDAVIVAVHGGLDRDPETGVLRVGDAPGENPAWNIAERFPQLAAVLYGHSHQRESGRRVGDVLLVQPRPWAAEVGRIDLTMARRAGGGWSLARSTAALLPVTRETTPDGTVIEATRAYHEAAEHYLDGSVAESPVALSAARARFEDSPLVDAIHEVQLHHARADVSLAALYHAGLEIPRGAVTVRELAALYLYDNELFAIEGSGGMLRAALENAARYFRTCVEPSCRTGPLIDESVPGFNYDMAQGVEYEIDLTRPVGSRVRNLTYQGGALRDDQPLRIALSSYRAAGSGGYSMFRGVQVAWRSRRDIRDLMIEYFTERKRLPGAADGNWRIVPPAAVETLAREAARPRVGGASRAVQ